jgi:hypothetical protein
MEKNLGTCIIIKHLVKYFATNYYIIVGTKMLKFSKKIFKIIIKKNHINFVKMKKNDESCKIKYLGICLLFFNIKSSKSINYLGRKKLYNKVTP